VFVDEFEDASDTLRRLTSSRRTVNFQRFCDGDVIHASDFDGCILTRHHPP